jgi:hypothetical protein
MENWSQTSGTRHKLEHFDYITGTDMKKEFFRIMADLDFVGVSVSCQLLFHIKIFQQTPYALVQFDRSY